MMPAPFELRLIVAADAEPAALLIRSAFGAIVPPLVPPPSALHETAETVAAQIAGGGGMVAEASATMMGVMLWGERADGLYLGRLSVSAAWRRAGVARAMVERGVEFARVSGLPRVHVGVRLVLAGNRRLFANLGFCETVLHTHEGFTNPTWVEMEKRL